MRIPFCLTVCEFGIDGGKIENENELLHQRGVPTYEKIDEKNIQECENFLTYRCEDDCK